MTGDPSHERVSAIFSIVIALPKSERSRALDELCAGMTELRAEVESLIEHHAPSFFAQSALAALDKLIADGHGADMPESAPRLQGYSDLKRIGAGAMGIVYRARQLSTRRDVAIKLLRGSALSQESLLRFRFEAEALARLSHPSIAQVFDAGVWEGPAERLPYLVIELVSGGVPITQVVAHMPVKDRVALFLQVCEGIAHAQGKGVIHRDIKPSNVLVGPDSRAKIIDFGIAKLETASVVHRVATVTGAVLGTPAYMSPEQAAGGSALADARSDVYSLGVLLHELLHERVNNDPTHPGLSLGSPQRFGWNRRHGRDLESVFRRATSVDPASRYPNAAELAEDLRRWVAGRPVLATRPGAWRRLSGWVSDHPAKFGVVLGVLLILGSALGTAVALWWAAFTPVEIRFDSDRGHAAALSRSGSELARWGSGVPRCIQFAQLVRLPVKLGAGTGVFIAHSNSADESVRNSFGLFPIRNDAEPFWRSEPPPTHPMLVERTSLCETQVSQRAPMLASWATIADVFDDLPGDEAVVCWHHGERSPCCIEIYQLDGTRLFRAWHNGHLHERCVLLEGKHLGFCGVNDDPLQDHSGKRTYQQSLAVFAIAPSKGLLDEVIETPRAPGTLRPVFYHAVLPPAPMTPDELSSVLDAEPSIARQHYSSAGGLTVELHAGGDETSQHGSMSIVLSPAGAEVARYGSLHGLNAPVPPVELLRVEGLPRSIRLRDGTELTAEHGTPQATP